MQRLYHKPLIGEASLKTDLSPAAWEQKYESGETPWDLSGPTPELVRLQSTLTGKGAALVPGGGRGHDALFLAQQGYEVDLVDFAPAALDAALIVAASAKLNIFAYRRDFFELPQTSFHRHRYDLIFEYTFFCAIDPARRAEYVEAMATMLKPGGLFIGLFFPLTTDKEGPPFVVDREQVEKLFRPYFELRFETPSASVKPRAGREFLGIFHRK